MLNLPNVPIEEDERTEREKLTDLKKPSESTKMHIARVKLNKSNRIKASQVKINKIAMNNELKAMTEIDNANKVTEINKRISNLEIMPSEIKKLSKEKSN